ncbi:hypothetical protein GLYMA_04G124250v4 [Glycine max]|nr:hypothetical protein GLYMA_04G124250v4 [Glycine max]KAH1111078.1 hypothetical protein GYH30_009728 [Glycine max]
MILLCWSIVDSLALNFQKAECMSQTSQNNCLSF